MSDSNGTNGNRILTLEQVASQRNAKDAQGRLLRHNATVKDVHEIVVEETTKVHEYYLNQIPPFVARMIQDALISYGLIQLSPDAQLAATPTDGATSDAAAAVVGDGAPGTTATPPAGSDPALPSQPEPAA